MGRRILVSAGEASGDLYASLVVRELRRRLPGTEFFGCTGPRLRAAGVEATSHVVLGAPHGFESWAADSPPSRAFVRAAQNWLDQALALPTASYSG